MRVNELAESIHVTADTVRYYTRIGLLTPEKSIENGYKHYNLSDQKRLLFIIKARSLGMSVSEVQEIIKLAPKSCNPILAPPKLLKSRRYNIVADAFIT